MAQNAENRHRHLALTNNQPRPKTRCFGVRCSKPETCFKSTADTKSRMEKQPTYNKYLLLFLSLLFDVLGMLTFTLPFVGESFDVIWAPVSSYLIYKMYGGTVGKVSGVIGLVLGEEADFEAQNCLPALNLIRRTKLYLSTEPAFSPNACYKLCLCPLSYKFRFSC